MMEFILSKIAMFLFAISVAVLMLYFSMGLGRVFIIYNSQYLANNIAKGIEDVSISKGLCGYIHLFVPRKITLVKNTETFPLFYRIRMYVQDAGDTKRIIIALFKAKGIDKNYLIGASQVVVDANVYLFDYINYIKSGGTVVDLDKNIVELYPDYVLRRGNSIIPKPMNTLFIIKDQHNGEKRIILIPCSRYVVTDCPDVLGLVKGQLGGMNCVEVEEIRERMGRTIR